MSCRVDTTPLIASSCVVSLYAGHGVRGDAVPSTGTHGAAPVYNDLSLPADAAKEYRWGIVTPPATGTLTPYEDGSFDLDVPADGTYTFTYRLWEDGTDLGTATGTIIVGAGVGLLTEAATAGDAITVTLISAASVSEAATAADQATTGGAISAVLTESVTAADALAAAMVVQTAVNEAIAAAEVASGGPQLAGAVAEAAAVADVLSVTASLVAQVAEAATASDAATVAQQLLALITEAAAAADQVTGAAPTTYSVTLAEVAAALDVITAALTSPTVWPLLAARGASAHSHGRTRPEQLSTATRSNVQ